MAVYRRVLLVVDLTDDSVAIGRKAQALATSLGAEVELLHVVEFVPVEPMGETLLPAVQIEEELLQRAQQRLEALASELGLAGAPCRVSTSLDGDVVASGNRDFKVTTETEDGQPVTVIDLKKGEMVLLTSSNEKLAPEDLKITPVPARADRLNYYGSPKH